MIIKNGAVALPGREEPEAIDIRFRGEKIVELGKNLAGDEEIIEAKGMLLLPGGIDPHVHFDDPGFTDREDFAFGSRFAASGGITTVIDMPCTSIPPVTTVANLEEKLKAVEKKAVIDYGFFGGVCPQSLGEGYPDNFRELSRIVFGFKTYFISVMELFSAVNHFQFRIILERAKELGTTILLHAEDYSYVAAATEYFMKRGDTPVYYYNSRPEAAEILAVRTALELATWSTFLRGKPPPWRRRVPPPARPAPSFSSLPSTTSSRRVPLSRLPPRSRNRGIGRPSGSSWRRGGSTSSPPTTPPARRRERIPVRSGPTTPGSRGRERFCPTSSPRVISRAGSP